MATSSTSPRRSRAGSRSRGLHTSDGRLARVVFRVRGVPHGTLESDVLHPVLGHLVGRAAGTDVVAIEGLPAGLAEDRLKALGAAAASSGGVALCHVVGSTPEAPTLEMATGRRPADRVIEVTPAMLRTARDELSTSTTEAVTTVSLGTPHYSVAEFERLVTLLDGAAVDPDVRLYVSTSRYVLGEIAGRGWVDLLESAGVRLVADTCTYVTPILESRDRVVMTDSAKWAYYAPGNLGVGVVFGSTEECVMTARTGRLVRDDDLWG